jgi:hypothetical protein
MQATISGALSQRSGDGGGGLPSETPRIRPGRKPATIMTGISTAAMLARRGGGRSVGESATARAEEVVIWTCLRVNGRHNRLAGRGPLMGIEHHRLAWRQHDLCELLRRFAAMIGDMIVGSMACKDVFKSKIVSSGRRTRLWPGRGSISAFRYREGPGVGSAWSSPHGSRRARSIGHQRVRGPSIIAAQGDNAGHQYRGRYRECSMAAREARVAPIPRSRHLQVAPGRR